MKRKNEDVLKMAEVAEGAQAAAPEVVMATTTKSGTDLDSFEKIDLFKKYAEPAKVTSVQDALSRIGNDQSKLLDLLYDGLKAEAARLARSSDDGWMVQDESGNEVAYAGTLISTEILNPMVKTFATITETAVVRDGKEVFITWDEAQNADEKRAVKKAAMEALRAQPATIAALKKKQLAMAATQE